MTASSATLKPYTRGTAMEQFIIKATSVEHGEYKQVRLYIWHDETILENLVNRRNRPVQFYKDQIIPALIKQHPKLADATMRWSQKAGCRCGCSPGFILNIKATSDIHVDLKRAPTEQDYIDAAHKFL